jgi:hypothetical protein
MSCKGQLISLALGDGTLNNNQMLSLMCKVESVSVEGRHIVRADVRTKQQERTWSPQKKVQPVNT